MTRVKFLKGKHYKGATYHVGDEAVVDDVWAGIFISQKAAVAVEAPRPTPPEVVETRDPVAVSRRGKR